MLTITVPETEYFDQAANDGRGKFLTRPSCTFRMEHSLVSISKWEAKWHILYFSPKEKTPEQAADYLRCMIVTPGVDPSVIQCLTRENLKLINDYISDPMTATTFNTENKKGGRHVPSSEEIYYQMTAFGIPFECEKWNLNRLLTLIRICDIRSKPQKKKSKEKTMQDWSRINSARRAGRM